MSASNFNVLWSCYVQSLLQPPQSWDAPRADEWICITARVIDRQIITIYTSHALPKFCIVCAHARRAIVMSGN